jgi:hypothetical protein
MKFIISIILIIILSLALGLYLPWWSIAIAAFIVAIAVQLKPGYAFLSGFLALLFFWSLLAWFISIKNEHILAHKISLLILKVDNPFLLIVVTGGLGALLAGLSALSGSLLRSIIRNS